MSSFKEFLASEEERSREETSRRDSVLADWVQTVETLLGEMTSFLKEEDEKGQLKIERTTHRIRERRIGTYEVPGLRIALGLKEVNVVPVARYSMGSMVGDSHGRSIKYGRVDLQGDGARYMPYRQAEEGGRLRWVVVDDWEYLWKPFDRESFLSALKSLFE